MLSPHTKASTSIKLDRSGITWLCRSNPLTKAGQRVQMAKMMILSLIPVAGLTLMSVLQLTHVAHFNQKSREIRDVLAFSMEAGNLIHFLQRERDMTALHVSSRNQGSETRILLTTSYPLTDDSLNRLTQWLGDKSGRPQFQTRKTFRRYLKSHRSELVAPDSSVREEVEFYTNCIRMLIEWLYTSIQSSRGGDDWRYLVAYQLMVISKEDLGVERTLGGVFFAKGGFETYDEYLWYMQKLNVGTGNFLAAKKFTPVINSMFEVRLNEQKRNVTTEIANMRKMICGYNFTSNVHQSVSWEKSTFWFDNMTVYLDIMFEVQLELGKIILNGMDASLSTDTESIIVSISLLCLIVLICPLIGASVRAIVTDIQRYARTLAGQTNALEKEKKRTDSLLFQMLPKPVAEQLKRNEHVTAENFEECTVFFSDIVGFTKISSNCTPMQVVSMLNNLYICFDTRIEMYDVYKIETIGDAYMVTSGVPQRNGLKHVSEIGTMALDLLHHISHLEIPHLPGTRMRLRAGIHSGPLVAGVVGSRMPRYCLFGDTVNTASRMESHGLPSTIHISPQTNALLHSFPEFITTPRGKTMIKGKGMLDTFFLMSKTGFEDVLSCMPGCKYFCSDDGEFDIVHSDSSAGDDLLGGSISPTLSPISMARHSVSESAALTLDD